ncbi:FG-GAP-like repeat-containing protein [Streptomyces sp. Amel2xC10]|uniref:FG-GAP-like repeat-containing protein n=1 Tax=Streptomyces sp. Amel2xC10 TaxID=1305826 RepID=UPI000A088418|nr:FG-GAP-like repeat-containing protein [Streptomyces sp. Amel2xC10]SMF85534.1 Repeat domain-containing protein [Streptomyces sp. Amel2xC10]
MEVTALRTETAETFANPDGSYTTDQYATAQRVRKNGRLVDIDTSLTRNPDGTYSAKATEVGVTFSGGGKGALVTVTRDGRSMSWSWPGTLPAPEVDGDTVIYRDVLDDVDLKLRAGTAGFGQLLIVNSAEAAANPTLSDIKLPLSTEGLDVEADDHGNMRAVNPAGQEVFTAPTPYMWDSSRPAAARSGDSTPPPPAHEFEAPFGAQEAPLELTLSEGELSLKPDIEVLTGADTQYPVYIDPSVSGSREAWTIAYSSASSTGFYNGNGWDEGDGNTVTSYARVGNPGDGTSRSFFRMDTSNLWNTKKVISSSTFRIKNSYSYSCTHREVQLWLTGAISSSTSWSKQPSWSTKLDTVSEAKGYNSTCAAGNIAFDVTSGAKQAASGKWTSITLGLRATTESDNLAYKRFDARTAVLSTTYNTTPDLPSSLDTIPSTKNSAGCGDTAPYGIIGNTDIYLTAKVSDPDGGTVKAQFNLWPTGHHPNDDPNGKLIVNTHVSATSGTVVKLKVTKAQLTPYISTANGNFSWKVQAEDGSLSSDWVPASGKPGCRFVFDPNRPSNPPGVTSTQFPDGSDGWPAETGNARTEGTFTLSNGGATDVVKYEYWTNWDSTVRTAAPSSQGGSVSVKLTPLAAGSQALYVRSIDKANNVSDRGTYLFYANSPGITDKPGDLNGDGHSDMYGVRTDGALWFYPGQGNGRLAPYTVASSTDFGGASITHRGDWTGDGYEDLVAAKTYGAEKKIHVYPNNGLGYACTARSESGDGAAQSCVLDRQELDVYDPAVKHWASADQILAIGDVDGPLDADGDGTVDVPGHTDLLVKEGDHLWLYFGSDSGYLDEYAEPVLIGDEGWSAYDIAAPGDVDGNGHVDLLARSKSSGHLHLYPGSGPAGEGLGADDTVRILAQTGWDTTTRPLFTSGGDADGDGTADLWATSHDTGKELYFYPAVTATDIGSPTAVGTSGWLNFQQLN